MSKVRSPLERLGDELDAAASRQAATLGRRRVARAPGRWWQRHLLVAILIVGVGGAGAVAVAATALLRHGSPVPLLRGGTPVAGKFNGAPAPGSVSYLTTSVPDPDGGAPWAMRYWTTDRGYACFQVGRYNDGHVGLISDAPSGGVFHPFQLGTSENGVSGCYPVDGAGHARIALHQSTAAGGATATACQDGVVTGDGHGHVVPAKFPPGCHPPSRTVDVGLLGPAARELTLNVAGKDHTVTPIGPEGAYLEVQRYVKPRSEVMGFHHKNPKLNFVGLAETSMALTPANDTIREVVYGDGTCQVHFSKGSDGACLSHTAWVKPQAIKPGNVRAPVRATAIDSQRVLVRFTARQTVPDRRSGYSITLIPDRYAHHRFIEYDYEHDIKAGETASKTISRGDGAYPAGRFTIRVTFRTAPNTPTLSPRAWSPGALVGTTHVTLR